MKTHFVLWPMLVLLAVSGCNCGKGEGDNDGGSTAVDPTRSTVVATSPVPADGTSTSEVTVTLLDAEGNPVAGVSVTLASDRAGDTVSDPAAASDASGVAVGSVASTEVGDAVITASAGGQVLGQTATVTFEVVGPTCNGQPVDTDTDPLHCGRCDNACPAGLNEEATCAGGQCGTTCAAGFDDCNPAVDGCEADLTSAATCGDCGTTCPDGANATGACVDPSTSTCGYDCAAGWGDCDPAVDGCEVRIDTAARCGDCATDCNLPTILNGVATCADPATGTCGVSCDVGSQNCDGDPTNGCEPLTSAAACGSCAVTCNDEPNASGICVEPTTGTCGLDCDPGYADCDLAQAGCETDTGVDMNHCGGCNRPCTVSGAEATATCSNSLCSRGCNGGFADCNLDLDDPTGDGCETDLSTGDCGCSLSATGATATCLTGGSGARTVIWTQLRDAGGTPVTGATVTIDSADLTWLGPVTESSSAPGTYFREAEPLAATGAVQVTLTASSATCGASAPLRPVTLDIVDPVIDAGATATGGCALRQTNLRVKVVAEEDGAPLAGAFVMLGEAVDAAAFHGSFEDTLAGAAGTLGNTALTDANGFATFVDHGTIGMEAVSIVSAGAANRAYVSLVGIDAGDVILSLPQLPPYPTRVSLGGNVTGASYPLDNDGVVQTAMIMPVLDLDFVAAFDLNRLLSDVRNLTISSLGFCRADGQTFPIPGNIHVPDQVELGACQLAGGHPWYIDHPSGGQVDLVGVRADGDIFSLLGLIGGTGTAEELLALMTPSAAGMITGVSAASNQTNLTIPLTETVTETMPVDIQGAPLGTLYALALADLDGANGTGRLFLEGFKVQQNATDLTTMVATSDGLSTFAGKSDLGVGLSTDGAATSIVMDRTTLNATSPRVFSDFFLYPAGAAVGRTFSWSDIAGTTPDHHYSKSVLRRVSALGDYARRYEPFWIVYTDPGHRLPSGSRGFSLPTLPASAPRGFDGGYLVPGFNQVNRWLFSGWYLGLNPNAAALDLRSFTFQNNTQELTRIVSESVAMP
ncbi:MAG: invasin domain 3-containing protein [Deltaproteobacteria bacterium]|nr:invasin domain 3-containing protein [Deltaproteobacteria bacterium]